MAVLKYTVLVKQDNSTDYVANVYDDGSVVLVSSSSNTTMPLEKDKQIIISNALLLFRTYEQISEFKVLRV